MFCCRRSGSSYTASVPNQIGLCVMRGMQRLRGDKIFFIATVGGNFVISLVLGSVFYDLPTTAESMNSRCVVLFFAVLFNALSSALEVSPRRRDVSTWHTKLTLL
jgi:hypothetical protein